MSADDTGDRPQRPASAQVWTVAGLLLAVSDALAARFAAVTVQGELSGLTRAASGHWYFSLKDASGAAAGMRCAMFRRSVQLVDFVPRDGQQVEVRGRLAVYEARGELQMVVESLRRVGAGSLYEEFLRLKARLEAQGLFAPERKRPLPAFPHCIGLITSAAGAALHDVLTTLQRRAPQVAIVLYPSLVQGAEAPAALAQALAVANQRAECDLLILCRGGGSIEDLWAFNDERVVRAVAESTLPVVCGIGHETDVTLADLAADLRAPTPTAAAELAAPAREECLAVLAGQTLRMSRRIQARLEAAMQRLDTAALRLKRPAQWLMGQRDRLEHLDLRLQQAGRQQRRRHAEGLPALAQRLQRAGQQGLARQQQQWLAREARLQAGDPRRVLARGYAWVESLSGQPVMSAGGVDVGQTLRTVWSDGQSLSTVTALERGIPTGLED